MANLTLVWLAVAEEEATPVEVAEEIQPYGLDDLRAEAGLLVAIGREQWEELQDYLESHPSARWPRPTYNGRAGSWNPEDGVIFE